MIESVRYADRGDFFELTLSAPQQRNAIGMREVQAVKAAIARIPESCRLLVVRSEGPVFCAGANLKEISQGLMSGDDFQSMTNTIANLNIPTLAIVEGDVFGGGAELLFSCDFRLGVFGGKLKIPAAAVGLCYPVEGIERMTQRLGSALARKLLLTTEALSFEDLAQHLAFDWLVAADDVAAHANELIAKLIGLAPLSMSAMLTIIKAVEEGRFDRAEAQALADQCSSSDDFLEGLRAQKEKRIPVFRSC